MTATAAPAVPPATSFRDSKHVRAAARTGHVHGHEHRRQIVCFGGPSLNHANAALNPYVLSLAAKKRPRVCLLVAESSQAGDHVSAFYRQFPSSCCRPTHLSSFLRDAARMDLRSELLRQDVIYVGGGRLVSLMNRWRVHGVDKILRDAWRNGAVLCGFRAGALCWFAEAVTCLDGRVRAARGLGLLPWSACVHYRDGWARRTAYRSYVSRGMRPGFAIEEGVALHFVGARLSGAVTAGPDGRAFKLEVRDGALTEAPLAVRDLTSAPRVSRC